MDKRDSHLLMLSTRPGTHTTRSGYQLLAEYISGAEFLQVKRQDSKALFSSFCGFLGRQLSFSRWYMGGSAVLEWKAVRRLWSGFEGVVHMMWADHDLGYLDLLLNRKRHRFCGTFHNCADTFPRTIRFISRLRRFDSVILMSETQRPFFLNAGVRPERIHVVLHGIDTDYFVPIEHSANERFTVLAVGEYRRNFPLLRRICEDIQGISHIQFHIVAPEKWRHLFKGLPNVKFFSRLSDKQLLYQYQNSSCLLQTAENATANNALLEAMACGIPVITERIGGIPEYVNSQAAILTDPGDAVALIQAIIRLAQSSQMQVDMRAAARKRAEELNWKNVALRTMEIYRNLWRQIF